MNTNTQNAIIPRKALSASHAHLQIERIDIDVSRIVCSVMVTMIVQMARTRNALLACTINW